MEYIVFSYKKTARSEISYIFGDHYKNNSKRESFDSLFFAKNLIFVIRRYMKRMEGGHHET